MLTLESCSAIAAQASATGMFWDAAHGRAIPVSDPSPELLPACSGTQRTAGKPMPYDMCYGMIVIPGGGGGRFTPPAASSGELPHFCEVCLMD